MSPTKFVRRSLSAISADLEHLGHDLCPTTIARLLGDQDYSLRVNLKRFTGPDHPDRDRQFRNIEVEIDRFREEGLPILSVDTKKKELVGDFKNAGELWCRQPEEVNVYDFLSDAVCRAVPYGLYDVLANRGHVRIGTSADTPAFAVEAIRSWWGRFGSKRYRGAGELLILADGGGSNGHRPRLWKLAVQEQLADRYGLHVTVCHYPTGASNSSSTAECRIFLSNMDLTHQPGGVAPGAASGPGVLDGACCTVGGRATPTLWNTLPHVPCTSVRSRNRFSSCSTSTTCNRSRSAITSAHSRS
jgi:hypothetical protein